MTRTAVHSDLRTVLVEAVAKTGLTCKAIAERAGLHPSTVAHMLAGRRTGTVETWDLVLTAAGVQVGYRIAKEKS